MRTLYPIAAVLAIGCGVPARHPAGECARVWTYAVDEEIDRAAVRRATEEWTAATQGRECFVWRRQDPRIRFTVAHSAAELAVWSTTVEWGITAGVAVDNKRAIVLVPQHYRPEQLRAVLVHEIGHVVIGHWHSTATPSTMREYVNESPLGPPIPESDVRKYCEVHGCSE